MLFNTYTYKMTVITFIYVSLHLKEEKRALQIAGIETSQLGDY